MQVPKTGMIPIKQCIFARFLNFGRQTNLGRRQRSKVHVSTYITEVREHAYLRLWYWCMVVEDAF